MQKKNNDWKSDGDAITVRHCTIHVVQFKKVCVRKCSTGKLTVQKCSAGKLTKMQCWKADTEAIRVVHSTPHVALPKIVWSRKSTTGKLTVMPLQWYTVHHTWYSPK